MSTSSKTSPYYMLAMRFKEEVAKKGITIDVRELKASSENLRLLKDPASGVQAGFVQGGLSNHIDAPDLFSMGRVITEPVWIFYRGAKARSHHPAQGQAHSHRARTAAGRAFSRASCLRRTASRPAIRN